MFRSLFILNLQHLVALEKIYVSVCRWICVYMILCKVCEYQVIVLCCVNLSQRIVWVGRKQLKPCCWQGLSQGYRSVYCRLSAGRGVWWWFFTGCSLLSPSSNSPHSAVQSSLLCLHQQNVIVHYNSNGCHNVWHSIYVHTVSYFDVSIRTVTTDLCSV